jgi:phage tail sheath protein FI
MPFQVSPGVVVTERDLTTVVPNVATSIGAVAGQFQWGPVLERVRITTENDLVKTFGEPTTNTFEHFWSAANYLAYSNNLLVVRNVKDDARNSVVGDDNAGFTGTNSTVVQNGDDYESDLSALTAGDTLFIAKYPGVRGNSLKAIALDGTGWATAEGTAAGARTTDQKLFLASFDSAPATSADVASVGGSNDEMHVLVIDEDGLFTGEPGEVVEAHGYVSKAIDAKKFNGSSNYVGNVLRNESKYIWLGSRNKITESSLDASPAADAGASKSGTTFKRLNAAAAADQIIGGSLTAGLDGSDLVNADLTAAYDLYVDADTVDVTLIMSGAGSTVVGSHIIDNIASKRKDCVAFVSPNRASVVTPASNDAAVTALKADSTALGSSNYAIMDGAWKYQYDRYRDIFVYVPMNGDIAGLCARTDFTNDAWWSPAGLTRGVIKNIVKSSWEPTKPDRDEIYQLGINPITTQQGAGVILFGDRTMQITPTAFDRINVRRLFIVLEKAIAVAAKAMLFEFNDEFTRSQFVNIVTPFLREVQGRRGLTDFKVVCDSSNNTGQVIDTNNFVGDIYIKPNRSINFIQLNFIAARSDVSFSEIGG